ncbi:uncharacterized protein BN744_00781 [Bacteroides sp. CAG:633]|nr:uncharacterized protein BN744_00781 [Bacteroides sp. CAG:633]
MLIIDNILQLAEEPRINLCQIVNAVDRIAFFQSLGNSKNTKISRMRQFVIKIIEMSTVVANKAMHTLANHTQTFLDNFLEATADRHDFTYRLHARTDFAAHSDKLRQVPARNLTNQVIELRCYISRVGCTHLANLIERIA